MKQEKNMVICDLVKEAAQQMGRTVLENNQEKLDNFQKAVLSYEQMLPVINSPKQLQEELEKYPLEDLEKDITSDFKLLKEAAEKARLQNVGNGASSCLIALTDLEKQQQKKINTILQAFYDKKSEDTVQESDLGTFKKKIIADKEMGEKYYYMIKEKFSHGTDNAKKVFAKYIPFNPIKNSKWEGTAYFDGEKISMSYYADLNNIRGAGVTWFHEHGHMIDKLTDNVSNKKKDFFNALQKDYLYNISQKTYTKIEEEVCDMRQHSAVSDLFHGLSREQINGCATHPRRRDGSTYWNEAVIAQEAFAYMFECQFDKVRYEQMKKYFPSALKEFEKILKEL